MAIESSNLIIPSILTGIGFLLHVIISKTKFFRDLNKVKELAGETKTESFPYQLYQSGNESSQIERITTKLSNNYRITIAVHGILLAFVVSSGKILLVFSSWYFVVWCGLILAIIVRSGRFSLELSDIMETKGPKEALRKCYSAKKFFNTSLVLLIISVALLPTIFILDESITSQSQLEPTFYLSILSSSFSIAVSFALFYFVTFRYSDFDYSYGEKNMVGLTLLIIGLGALLYSISPTESLNLTMADGSILQIPFIIFLLPIFGILYFCIILAHFINLGMMCLPNKYLKIYAKIFLKGWF